MQRRKEYLNDHIRYRNIVQFVTAEVVVVAAVVVAIVVIFHAAYLSFFFVLQILDWTFYGVIEDGTDALACGSTSFATAASDTAGCRDESKLR
jgi:hypothetical protein